MIINTKNKSISRLIQAQKRLDGQIAEDVFIEMHSLTNTGELVYLFIGTREAGPVLQYTEDGSGKYVGDRYAGAKVEPERINFAPGAWTPLYSNNNYGKRYAAGGTWDGHTKFRMGEHADIDNVKNYVIRNGELEQLPEYQNDEGNITCYEIDCSPSWSIWFATASEAMANRLPQDYNFRNLMDVITTFNI